MLRELHSSQFKPNIRTERGCQRISAVNFNNMFHALVNVNCDRKREKRETRDNEKLTIKSGADAMFRHSDGN
jgi:hypothetical protein